jgi:putative endonuclease
VDPGTPQRSAWYLYLIECRNGRLYTGIATDPQRRFTEHAAGRGAMYTRINRPLRLLGCRPYANRSQATRAEIGLKRLDRRGKLAWARDNPEVLPTDCARQTATIDPGQASSGPPGLG